jgi:hypothetical protein
MNSPQQQHEWVKPKKRRDELHQRGSQRISIGDMAQLVTQHQSQGLCLIGFCEFLGNDDLTLS